MDEIADSMKRPQHTLKKQHQKCIEKYSNLYAQLEQQISQKIKSDT